MFARKKRMWIVVAAVLALGVIGGGTGVGIAVSNNGSSSGDGDNDQPITGSALTNCTEAALAGQPEGSTVTETEIGDDGAAYGVEIRLADGSEIEVSLDADCVVMGQEADVDGPNDEDGPDDVDGPDDEDGPNDEDGPDDDGPNDA